MAFALTTGSIALTVAGGAFFKTMGMVGGVLSGVHSQIQQVTKATRNMFLGAVGAATVAVRTYGTFERSMRKATAVSEVSEAQFERMSLMAEKQSIRLNIAAKDAADAFYFLGSAGLNVADQMKAFVPVATLAKAATMDMGSVAEMLVDTMKGFQVAFEHSTHVTDVLAKAVTSSNMTFNQLGQTLSIVSGVARKANNSLEDTVTLVAAMANVGIKGSRAGTSLRRSLLNLMAPVSSIRQQLQKYNIAVYDSLGRMKPMIQLIGEISEKLRYASEEERNMAFKVIFGARAIAGQIAIFDKGRDALDAFAESLRKSGGTAEAIAQKQMRALLEQLGKVWRRVKRLTRTIGEFLAPAVQRLGEALGIATDKLDEFLEKHKLDVQEWAERWALRILYVKDILKGLVKWIVADWRTAVMDALKSTLPLWEAFGKSLEYIWLKIKVSFINMLADMHNAFVDKIKSWAKWGMFGIGGMALARLIPRAEKAEYTWGEVGKGIAAQFGMAGRGFKPPKEILDIEKKARKAYNKASLELQEKYEKLRADQAAKAPGIPGIPEAPPFHAAPGIRPQATLIPDAMAAARVGFVGIREAWAQIAAGAKRTGEEQLRVAQKQLKEAEKQTPYLEKIADKTIEIGAGY